MNEFHNRMTEFDKRMNRAHRQSKFLFWISILLVFFVLTLAGFALFQIAAAFEATDWSSGIKPFVEKLWCGRTGCINNE